MRRRSPEEKLATKREALIARTAAILHIDAQAAYDLLTLERKQSLRLNPLKASTTATLRDLKDSGWQGEQYSWMKDGYSVSSSIKDLRDSSIIADGLAYIQNAASWLPVLALDPKAGETIFDVCAAPGGKTTHIAALANNEAIITANDNSRNRLAKLQANCQRLDAHISQFTLIDGQQLARRMDDQKFDKILLDAPCSGEGLIDASKDKDIATWSVAHIKRLQQLQKRLLSQAWQLLKPGGVLVYSTCTMAPEENEAVIEYALRTHEDMHIEQVGFDLPNRVPALLSWNGKTYSPTLQACLRLKPSVTAEAFFVCKLRKVE